jgi:hypothetical protein
MWYENIDSEGEYAPRILATEIEDVFSVTTGDIDNDGDVDVLSGSISDTNIIWYENVNNGLLFIKHLISNDDEGSTESVVLVDLDNDNYLDVVCPVGSKIYWYENEDAQGNFSDKKVVVNFINAKSIVAVDLDGDGDKDIVAGSTVEVEINWYENINNSDSFIEREIDTIDAQSINCEDYDLDGDLDLMTADYEGNRIVFYENLDGLGNFGVEEVISSQVENPVQIYSADLDSDGDKDIISASIGDDKVAWYENNGEGGFGSQNIILVDSSNTPRNVSAAFIDSDNDIDVIVSFSKFDEGEKILWFSNLITLNIVESVTDNINSYPNPVSNILHFNSELNISQIKVFNELGKKIKENTNSNTIDLSSLVEGIYFIKIVDVEGSQATQKIIKS